MAQPRGTTDSLILRLLRDEGPLSRAELARRGGLSATTLTRAAQRLLDRGLVSEGAPPAAAIGRPPIDLALDADAHRIVAVHVGARTVQIGLADLRATIARTQGFAFAADADPARVLARLAALTQELIAESGTSRDAILGIGIGVPGPVDRERRHLLLSIHSGWRDVPVAQLVERATGFPTLVDHNVRAMALAEYVYRREPDMRSLFYVYLGTGLGAGLVVGGRAFRPGNHGVTELGHVQVVENGAACACGSRGCLETVLSERHLADEVARAGGDAARPMRSAAAIPAVRAALVEHLTAALAGAVNLLNPERIVLGGLFTDAPDAMIDEIELALAARVFPVLRGSFRVRRSALGRDAPLAGAAAAALDRYFYRDEAAAS